MASDRQSFLFVLALVLLALFLCVSRACHECASVNWCGAGFALCRNSESWKESRLHDGLTVGTYETWLLLGSSKSTRLTSSTTSKFSGTFRHPLPTAAETECRDGLRNEELGRQYRFRSLSDLARWALHHAAATCRPVLPSLWDVGGVVRTACGD